MEFITTLPEKKHKRYNKNKKKAWRKKVDMKDVEEGLEEKRQEERYGGPLGERESTELMFLDVGDGKTFDVDGKTEILEDKPIIDKIKPDSVLKTSKKKRSSAPLRCHQYLSGLGGAKDPKRGKRNKVKAPEEKMNQITKNKIALESQSAKAQGKLKELKEKREEFVMKKLNKPKSNRLDNYDEDLWEEETILDTVEESFLKDGIKFRDRVLQKAKVNIPSTRDNKTTALPALAVPMPGQSYNPRYEDHQKLMKRAIEHEEIKQDRIERPYRTTYHMFPAKGTHNTDKTWMEEMSEGLPTGGSTEVQEEEYEEVTEEQLKTNEDNNEWEDVEESNEGEDEEVEDEDEVEDEEENESVEEGDDEEDEDEDDEEDEEDEEEDEDEKKEDNNTAEKSIVNDLERQSKKKEELIPQKSKSDIILNGKRKGQKRSVDDNTEGLNKKKKIEPNNNGEAGSKMKKAKKEITKKMVTVSSGGTNNPKPAQQRRKEKELKLAAEEKANEKKLKQRESEVFRVKSLEKELDELQKKKDKLRAKREEKIKNQMYKPQRMNYFRYREQDLAVALGDELADSIRSVKPKTNLMEEHFNRLQKRNMVEIRIRRKVKRKPKRMVKREQKPDYSMVDKLAKES